LVSIDNPSILIQRNGYATFTHDTLSLSRKEFTKTKVRAQNIQALNYLYLGFVTLCKALRGAGAKDSLARGCRGALFYICSLGSFVGKHHSFALTGELINETSYEKGRGYYLAL